MPRPMRLIGLAGAQKSGKDTVAKMLIEIGQQRNTKVVRRAFADKLKVSAAKALDLKPTVRLPETDGMGDDEVLIWMMDRLKDGGEVEVGIPEIYRSIDFGSTISGRRFLQLYGTESHREVFGYDFWVDALLPPDGPGHTWDENFDGAELGVITDVRFENEAERVSVYGDLVEIIRPGCERDPSHASEHGIPERLIDKELFNGSDLDSLRGQAVALYDWVMA